jgi:hypothetical protein
MAEKAQAKQVEACCERKSQSPASALSLRVVGGAGDHGYGSLVSIRIEALAPIM